MQTNLLIDEFTDEVVSGQDVYKAGPQSEVVLSGFRLHRMEVLNWGTFDQRPWLLDLKGGTALLTGANGSGKSTLVDGLLTLLVPNRRRSYNQASSGVGKKKERDEKSYVKGAFARTRAEDAYGSRSQFLREGNELSVLMAYFVEATTGKEVTLAEVLWIENGGVRKFYVLADAELKTAYFVQCQNVPTLKKQLKVNDAEVYDNFTAYSKQFRKRFGLQSEKALDLFNQTVSIKEIGGLNDFVRKHMLEKADVRAKIDELQESYQNLTISHTAIQKARRQLEALEPLGKEAKRYKRLEREVADLIRFQQILPAFFARERLALLSAEQQEIEQSLAQGQSQRDECDRTLATLRQQEKDVEFSINQDDTGQRLQALAKDIQQTQQTVASRHRKAESYNELAQRLGFETYSDSETFYAARAQGDSLSEEIAEALGTLEVQRDEQKVVQTDLRRQQQTLEAELTSLRGRTSQIPSANLRIRDRLLESLNLPAADLPFIGELLRVRSDAKDWEGAIERLLHNFGLCLLVPETHYKVVNAYVNKTHLRGRLVYYRVGEADNKATQRRSEVANQIPARVEVKQDDLFYPWLRDRLSQQFNYVCCETEEQFRRENKAITQTGLIKQGKGRHEKDDRSKIGDRSRYILGWDNASKIAALSDELAQVTKQLAQVEAEIRELEQRRGQRRSQQGWLQSFMAFTDFADMDWQSAQADLQTLQAQEKELKESSDVLRKLQAQLRAVQGEIETASVSRDRALQRIQTLCDRQSRNQLQQTQCQHKLKTVEPADIDTFAQQMAKKLKSYTLSLETIAEDESAMKDAIQQQLIRRQKQQTESRAAVERCLYKFSTEFKEETLELGHTYEYLPEYLKLQKEIEQDDLPRHEKKFKELMNDKIVVAISLFKNNLVSQEEEIRAAIDDINQALRLIDYTDSTYIEIRCDTTRNQEVRDFKADLTACLGDVTRQTAEDNEARFQMIQKRLIKRFQEEDRWTRLVTDVRNWLDFSVSERYRADESEKEHHTDSSGKSGGQKVKLAYTILASAIAYQYGLNPEADTQKSFRFVVIDEAFSKSDDSNARYAMELFKNLDLQLLVITPKDKINVIEPYIDSLHFVHNSPEGNYSQIASVSIETYREKREAALSEGA
ncbi:MAG: SbcC/MukB-like Walker B domain-containing protein [Cyanobacteria bacterium J06634_6]